MSDVEVQVQCPTCGTPVSKTGGGEGLCPGCLLELALDDTSLEAEVLFETQEAPTLQYSAEGFSEGDIHGERYRIRSLLGRGGMGEVWRAYDLKLRLDVALKALRSELVSNPEALETLRQEVRAAREVISPNVCRVFDLQELDGQELVAMEYIDGTTLQEILKERGPLELNEAREIASQFLAGLEAIHEAGLVHRDIKPENVMLTRTGRVVVMDFGISKGLGEGRGGMVAGTPAYMSPEQADGSELDARGDLFSAGVVLAEMVEPGGVGTFEARKKIWEGIHRESPRVSETPWTRVIAQAVASDREARFERASALARALEEVTLRAAGDETAKPYPGLSYFQEEDADYFFGRELEVETLWKKLRRPHLLAVIGPSGAGKSSFLRAGLLPTLTDGWQAIISTPGNRPFDHLARVLAEALGDSPGVAELLPRFEETDIAVELLSEWRKRSKHGLLIVDQFEELFTQNSEDVQQGFVELLGRLPLEADLFVLLSMRDDFLMHCHRFEALRPVFSEPSPLDPPLGAALRRALVEPALKCGYRFADEGIIEEMLGEVEGERAALPLLAFAAAQLWEKRDRETGLLTRAAHDEIGGVGGALAQHAESTLEELGEDGLRIVRELFRNLVTAQGTRASRNRKELVSVFATTGAWSAGAEGLPPASSGEPVGNRTDAGYRAPGNAEDVLDALIDARLLTSYEVPGDDAERPEHHIEIVHESLLASWPRLVRWRTQDAQGAQLRDELRSQAKLWNEHGRSVDYLWTGTAFKEYELWRERYPGGLTDTEEAFAKAMTSLATRRRRRLRIAATAVVLLAVIVAAVTGGLWLRSEAEARRAEAAKLLALAQLRLEEDPTEALAYTTASLDLADSGQARVFAITALSEAPPVRVLDGLEKAGRGPAFSEDNRWLAVAGHAADVHVLSESGGAHLRLPGHLASPEGSNVAIWASNDLLVTWHFTQDFVRIWRIPGGELVRKIEFGTPEGAWTWRQVGDERLFAYTGWTDSETNRDILQLRSWRLPDGEVEELGRIDRTAFGATWSVVDLDASGWWYGKGKKIFYRQLPLREGASDRLLGEHESDESDWFALREPGRLWTRDASTDELLRWDLTLSNGQPLQVIPRPADATEDTSLAPDRSGRWLKGVEPMGNAVKLWDLQALPGSRGLELKRRASWYGAASRFHPGSLWLVASVSTSKGAWDQVTFWPLPQRPPSVIEGYADFQRPLAVGPDSQWLASSWPDGSLRLWPLPGNSQRNVRVLGEQGDFGRSLGLTFDPSGKLLAGTGFGVFLVFLDDGSVRRLEGFSGEHMIKEGGAAFSPSGRLFAAASGWSPPETAKELRIWNLETGEFQVFGLEQTRIPRGDDGSDPYSDTLLVAGIESLAFTDESTLYSAGHEGLLRWNLEDGSWERLVTVDFGHRAFLRLSDDRQQLITWVLPPPEQCGPGVLMPLVLHDLRTGGTRNLAPAIKCSDHPLAFDGSLSVYVTGEPDGTLRVGRVDGGEPHLLAGHRGPMDNLVISPDLGWIASTGEDQTIRIWPMPDLDKPPLHTLPYEELIAKLQSLTNLRAVRDPASSTGWSIEIGPFPGWAEVPEW